MPVEAVTPSSGVQTAAAAREPKQTMDSEVFMHLLVTQLRNQDPSSPMDTNQMISQTTELAMMEQLTTMAGLDEENFSLQMRTSAAALIGRTVSYTGTDGVSVTGVATSVSFVNAVPTVTVGGKEIQLDWISGVVDTPAAVPEPNPAPVIPPAPASDSVVETTPAGTGSASSTQPVS
ncbi:flagellar hook capping protein [Arthrobacter jiangjiafuii]|uniref:Flagellar hook capping protein n=1 Tax=Arthrobacter jiangjiafuii TaxID=2817475 RepID=A0A975R1H1_9MICC|nr:flagellar hook capping FlgD N-terminal domain-containing protein [Arthrobacter jiangjiafuii]MBP3045196.1 flagellar hook capping protein [Arthrobacter jiangjiafuii]QWC10491.1 flagellar hook capping protein [Arthrobacter jiangjiafuii]